MGEKGRFNHLDASQRRSIEAGLSSGESLSQIARRMGVATSTVTQVRRHERECLDVRAPWSRTGPLALSCRLSCSGCASSSGPPSPGSPGNSKMHHSFLPHVSADEKRERRSVDNRLPEPGEPAPLANRPIFGPLGFARPGA